MTNNPIYGLQINQPKCGGWVTLDVRALHWPVGGVYIRWKGTTQMYIKGSQQ